jgi:Arc/MetJ-type ribon-helix-helix transcriptional regulator
MATDKPREKLSISLPESSVLFVEQYRKAYKVGSRSEVFDIALRALREKELERAYAQASAQESEFTELDATSSDGLDDDPTW